MFDFQKLYGRFEAVYYTEIIMFLTELILLVIAILYIRKTKLGRYFIFYILFDFILLISNLILSAYTGISNHLKNEFVNYLNNSVALIELLVYFYFFIQVLSKRVRRPLTILAFFFLIIILIYACNKFSFLTTRQGYVANLIGVAEFILLIPPCLLFFYTLLKTNSSMRLFERPSFWIVTGIFFYSFISIPFYLLKKYIDDNYISLTYAFNAALYITPFTLNFVFLIKAFLCKKTLTI